MERCVTKSSFKQFIFLDTDTIFIQDLLHELRSDVICAKVVDLANPPIGVLEEVMRAAGFSALPKECRVDASEDITYLANANGGFYSIPKQFADSLFESWRRWSLWLLANPEPLHKVNKTAHIDQISFCMAIHDTGLPFEFIPSNLNYFVHFAGPHSIFTAIRQNQSRCCITTNDSVNVVGLLDPPGATTPAEKEAVAQANSQIAKHFNNKLFWEMRYANFSERGSGVGSRGENLEYKRNLLLTQGVEKVRSVLDVGCGDLEVVRALNLTGYVGVDQSTKTLEIAKRARPDWAFLQAPALNASPAEMVLCFEVLIHQESLTAYHQLIHYLAEKLREYCLSQAMKRRVKSIRGNSMLFFYEPLSRSLRKTGKFESVEAVGRRTDVTIFRCETRRSRLGRLFHRWLGRRT